jgi:hypothetical protein
VLAVTEAALHPKRLALAIHDDNGVQAVRLARTAEVFE